MKPWHVALGALGLLALAVAGARAQRALAVDVIAPPVRPALSLESATPPRRSPGEEILGEVRRICALLHEPGITARQLAERLGRVTYDDDRMGPDFVPASPHFKAGQVALQTDEEFRPIPAPEWIDLDLAHPTDLPLRLLEAALGPTSETYTPGHVRTIIRDPQQDTARPCEILAEVNWDPDIALPGSVVMALTIRH